MERYQGPKSRRTTPRSLVCRCPRPEDRGAVIAELGGPLGGFSQLLRHSLCAAASRERTKGREVRERYIRSTARGCGRVVSQEKRRFMQAFLWSARARTPVSPLFSRPRRSRLGPTWRTDQPGPASPWRAPRLPLGKTPAEPREQGPRDTPPSEPRSEGPQPNAVAPEGALGAVGVAVVNQRGPSAPRLSPRPARPPDASHAEVRIRTGDDHPARLVPPALAVVDEQHATLARRRHGVRLAADRARGGGVRDERRGHPDDAGQHKVTRSRHIRSSSRPPIAF
jgi:hypothetical protein